MLHVIYLSVAGAKVLPPGFSCELVEFPAIARELCPNANLQHEA
jgi:hypothetical protein